MNHTELLYMYKRMKTLPEKIPPKQLMQLEEKKGICFIDIDSIYITDIEISFGEGCIISPNVYFLGRSGNKITIGDFSIIQQNTVIIADTISVSIGSQCYIGGKIIDCIIADHVETGLYTELTRSFLGEHTVAKHSCYLGDTETGENVNIAYGTVTANYDGTPIKNKTIIGNRVKTGINSNLVSKKGGEAPNKPGILIIGDDVTIGANAIVTKDVPAGVTVVGLNKILEKKD